MNALNAAQSLRFFLPELALVLTALTVLVVDLALARHHRRELPAAGITLSGLALTLGLAAAQWSWPSQAIFSGLMVVDPFAVFFKVLILVCTMAAVIFVFRSNELVDDARAETYALLLVLALSSMLLASSSHLLMIYLAFEGVSLTCYVLAGMSRGNRRASEAALKYVIYGGVASGVLLFGMSYLFGLTGTLDLIVLHDRMISLGAAMASGRVLDLALVTSVAFILAGIGYKIAAAPFHMWCPDVYEGSPTPIVAVFSVVPKAAGIAMLIRFFYVGMATPQGAGLYQSATQLPWVALLGVLAAATMTAGNFGALWQTNLKRLFAYSSIAHAGYMMLGVVVLGVNGVSAVLFYMAVYAAMNLGAFFCVVALHNASEGDDLAAVRGLGHREPVLAACFTIFLLSLTGLPPLAGFIGKYFLFASVLEHGGLWYDILIVVAVINSAVSLFFYAKVLRALYLDRPVRDHAIRVPLLQFMSIIALAAFTLIMGVVSFGISSLKDTASQAIVLHGQQVPPDAPVAMRRRDSN